MRMEVAMAVRRVFVTGRMRSRMRMDRRDRRAARAGMGETERKREQHRQQRLAAESDDAEPRCQRQATPWKTCSHEVRSPAQRAITGTVLSGFAVTRHSRFSGE